MRLPIAFLIVLFNWQCFAQNPEIFQTPESDKFLKLVFTTKNGLPQNTPSSIVQTKDGYIWMTTFGGLARFDGVKFTVFTTSNTPALINNRWTAMYEDSNGVLWIGSEDGDLISYQNGTFSVIKKSEGAPVDSTITSLYVDKNNILWIGSSVGLKNYSLQTKQFQRFDKKTLLKNPPRTPLAINEFAEDAENNLWIASNQGLIRFRDGQFTNFNTAEGLPDNFVNSVKVDSKNVLRVLSGYELGKFENGVFTSLNKTSKSGEVSRIAIDKENHCFYVVGKTLYETNESETKSFNISDVINSRPDSILVDREGLIWIGTDDCLIQLKPRQIYVYSYLRDKLWSSVTTIIGDGEDSVWSASTGKLLKWKDGKFDLISFPRYGADYIISALAVDKENALWIGSLNNGINKFKDNKLSELPDESAFVRRIGVLFFDRRQNLWIGSKTEGLQKYENGAVTQHYTTKDGLVNNAIVCIFEDSQGVMWIGTRNGLSRFENGIFTNFTTENGLTNNSIRDIYEDPDGALWIATYGGGILHYRDGKFFSISSKDGLPEDIASRILVDDNDNFWILGNQGVYTISRKSLNDFADGKIKSVYCNVYNEKDGMEVGEGNGGNQPSGWKAADGKLWFPMIRGGIIINPIQPNTLPPPVYIEEASLNKQKIDTDKQIEITPDQFNLEINYTAINFDKPAQIQFRYKLEGFDEDWQEVGNRRAAYYPYLPPGHYKFRVMATLGGNVWSPNDANLQIVVKTPFWQTLWFYTLVFLFVIALIIVAYQFRLRSITRKRLNQQEFSRQLINAHESERFRIAAELHDSLGQELLIIKNWALLGLNKVKQNSDVAKQLKEISETASKALEETRVISHNLRPNHLQRFGLSETLKNMAKQIEESARINFSIEIENIDELFSPQSQLSIYRIIQESLTNIVKHAKAENVSLRIFNQLERAEISIQDDGIGFDMHSPRHSRNRGAGFGLDNIIQRTEILGGKYSIQSNPGGGTRLFISLPVVNNYDET